MPPSQLQLTGERQVASDLDQIAPDHKARYKFAADYIENEIGGSASALDAACGNGYGSYVLAVDAGIRTTGLDISQDAIDCANTHYNIPGLTTYCRIDFVTQQIPAATYDCVVCFETLEHMLNPEVLLEKFAEVSDQLICSVPNEDVVPYEHANFPFHFKHYTIEQFEELLNNAGWTVNDWYTQYDKQEGDVYEADDGKTLIVIAERDLT